MWITGACYIFKGDGVLLAEKGEKRGFLYQRREKKDSTKGKGKAQGFWKGCSIRGLGSVDGDTKKRGKQDLSRHKGEKRRLEARLKCAGS